MGIAPGFAPSEFRVSFTTLASAEVYRQRPVPNLDPRGRDALEMKQVGVASVVEKTFLFFKEMVTVVETTAFFVCLFVRSFVC